MPTITKSLVALMWVLSLTAGEAASNEPVRIKVHGEDSKLARSVQGAELGDAEAWIYGDTVILVRIFPELRDYRIEDAPPGIVPWRPAWIGEWPFIKHLPKDEADLVVLSSRLTLLYREQDGRTCVVNELSGKRISTEKDATQDKTAVELPCSDVWTKFETLAACPPSQRQEIEAQLRKPPRPPRFRRR